jgi:hypothetical protein
MKYLLKLERIDKEKLERIDKEKLGRQDSALIIDGRYYKVSESGMIPLGNKKMVALELLTNQLKDTRADLGILELNTAYNQIAKKR